MATHSSILAREIPWTEEPGGLPSMGSQRVKHNTTERFSYAYLDFLEKRKKYIYIYICVCVYIYIYEK